MIAVGLIPLVIFGLIALLPILRDDDDVDEVGDDEIDLDIEEVVANEEDVIEDEPADEATDTTTTVTQTDGNGAQSEVVIDSTVVVQGAPIEVNGTEERDVIDAQITPTVNLQINALGGDDAVSFGYSTSVDPGDGADVLELTITPEALANGDLETGVVQFDDPSDALVIEIEDGAEGFVHEVRLVNSTEPDASTTQDTETLFYVLSPNSELTINEAASAEAGEIVFEDGAQVLVQIALGTETVETTGTDEDGNDVQVVTGGINDDPTILLNREVTTAQTFNF